MRENFKIKSSALEAIALINDLMKSFPDCSIKVKVDVLETQSGWNVTYATTAISSNHSSIPHNVTTKVKFLIEIQTQGYHQINKMIDFIYAYTKFETGILNKDVELDFHCSIYP